MQAETLKRALTTEADYEIGLQVVPRPPPSTGGDLQTSLSAGLLRNGLKCQPLGQLNKSCAGRLLASDRWASGIVAAADNRMDIDDIKRRLIELQIEHRDLDEAIDRLAQQAGVDELKLRRLKKRKLQIKDLVAQLEMLLVPDIPA
jgi:hypothetical protein